MNIMRTILTVASLGALSAVASAALWLPRGTEVDLRFDQSLSSNHAHAGDQVRMEVARDVVIDGHVILRAGTRVQGIVAKAEKNGRYGKNGVLRVAINPISATDGKMISVEPREEGKAFGGAKTNEAAAATVGGAVLLGPVGLVGGYFVAGKQIHIKPGQWMSTEVAHGVRLS